MKYMKCIYILFISMFFLIQGMSGQKEIFDAIKNDDVDRLSNVLIVESINDCVEINESSYNLLALALKLGSADVVEYLITAGADVNHVCTTETPLMYAAKYGRIESMKSLLKAGADPKVKNGNKSVLDYAKKSQRKEMASYLKEHLDNY